MSRPSLALLTVGAGLLLVGCAGDPRSVYRIDIDEVAPALETFDDEACEHLQFVLDPVRLDRFRDAPREQRPDVLRQLWAELDPTPTTSVNERRVDHYRRLAYARSHFGREKAPGFDRRGELLLRYGVPDERRVVPADIVEGRGLVPPREIWVYYWLGHAYEMEDARFQGDFLDAYRSRIGIEDVDRDIAALAADSDVPAGVGNQGPAPLDAEEQFALDKLRTMLERGQMGLRTRPRAYLHDYGGQPLDYVFDVQTFADSTSERTRVDVNTAFLGKDLDYAPGLGAYAATLETEIAVRTPDWRDVTHLERRTADVRSDVDDREGVLVVDQSTLYVDPGMYRLALVVRDLGSGNLGIRQFEVDVPAYPAEKFGVSDLQVALDVLPAGHDRDSTFVKGRYRVVPFPLGDFPPERDLHLYFEVYGLRLGDDGFSKYEIHFIVRPRQPREGGWFGSSRGRVAPGVALTYRGRSFGRTAQETLSLESETLDEGVYDLTIKVRDLLRDLTVSRRATFSIHR
ncbi:MAG: GWxTD domain-containing protein [bacterium]